MGRREGGGPGGYRSPADRIQEVKAKEFSGRGGSTTWSEWSRQIKIPMVTMFDEPSLQMSMLKAEGSKLELSFEYLVTPEKMEWVTVISHQAILMSMCLQSMVEELVRIRAGEKDPQRITKCSIKKARSRTAGANTNNTSDQSPDADEGCGGPVDYTVRKLAEKFSVVNMKSASKAAEDVFVENEVFNSSSVSEESIGD